MRIVDSNGLQILDKYKYMQPGSTIEDLRFLKLFFKKMGEIMPGFDNEVILKYPHLEAINHVHHAGNS